MDSLGKDVLFNIATMLDLDELLNFCSSNSRINQLICQGEAIWNFKLTKEFPDYKSHIDKRGREAYELLIGLTKLKEVIKYQGSIYQLYKETKLYLYNDQIAILPSEIGNLSQLRELYLNNNQIKTLPPEIGKLSNLRELWLYNNQIKSIPSEIGNLNQLQKLWLHNNQIKILPPEISKLSNLKYLYLHNNKITSLPPEISKLSNLLKLYLNKNVVLPPGLKLPVVYV